MESIDVGVLDALWQLPELALAVVNREVRFVRVNDAFAARNGVAADAHAGRLIGEVVTDGAGPAIRTVQGVLATGRPVELVLEPEADPRVGASGPVRRRSERYLPVFGPAHTPCGVVVVVREVGDADVLRAELDERSDQLRLAVEASRLGVWEWDAASGLVRWSPELERLLGMAPGRFDGTFDGYLALVHPDDRAAVLEAIERSFQLGEPHHVEHRAVVDGDIRWIEGRGAVMRDGLGEPIGLRGVALDVTDRKFAEERLRQEKAVFESVADVTGAVGVNRDRTSVAQAVADAARRHCDAAWIAVLVDDGARWSVAAGSGPVDEHMAALAGSAARTAEAPVVQLSSESRSGPEAGVVLVAPMRDPAAVLGAVVAAYPHPPRSLAHHQQILAGIAAHAVVALENARLHEAARREIAARQAALEGRDHVARVLQRSLLPAELPVVPGVELAARYLPLVDDIGGDFYDAFPLRGREWAVVIGDVQGKGPEAAAVTALARYTIRTAVGSHADPGAALGVLNTALLADRSGDPRFCTGVLARVRPRPAHTQVRMAVAGHPPVLILRDDGRIDLVGPTGPLLGVFRDVRVRTVDVALGPGDACVLYTDGATDVRHDGRTFGEAALHEVVAGCRGLPAAAIATSIVDAVLGFQRGDRRDDLALLVLHVPPLTPADDDRSPAAPAPGPLG